MKHYIPKEDLRYYLRTTKKDIEFQQENTQVFMLWSSILYCLDCLDNKLFIFYIYRKGRIDDEDLLQM